MRAAEKRSSTEARIATRSSSATRGTRSASAAASEPKKPSIPSRMISGSAPVGSASSGVPQAIDSIATSPNGSGHEPGMSVA